VKGLFSKYGSTDKKKSRPTQEASKKIKINEVVDVSVSSSEHSNKSDIIVPNDKASTSWDGSNNLTIWSDSQHQYFMKRYPWLEITNPDSVGCNMYAQITSLTVDSNKHVHLSLFTMAVSRSSFMWFY
jgi:hypothetical protein